MPTWAILGPLAPKIYSELAFMTAQNKKAQVLDSLGIFVWIPGRGERIRTSGLYVPNVALYQAKLHPDVIDFDCEPIKKSGESNQTIIVAELRATPKPARPPDTFSPLQPGLARPLA